MNLPSQWFYVNLEFGRWYCFGCVWLRGHGTYWRWGRLRGTREITLAMSQEQRHDA